ncbi:MAG: esterase/lipase family protein [Rickettsiales bacterium]
MRDGVIVLHGIFRTHRSMRKLVNFLEKDVFEVLNLGYPSTKHPIETIADVIHPSICHHPHDRKYVQDFLAPFS